MSFSTQKTMSRRLTNPTVWVFLVASAIMHAYGVSSEQTAQAMADDPTSAALQRITAAADAAAEQNPLLCRGALEVSSEDNGAGSTRYVFRRIFTSTARELEAEAMDAIIREVAGDLEWRIDDERDVHCPIDEVSKKLKKSIASDPRFEGCAILEGQFIRNPVDASLGWAPRFRVITESPNDGVARPGLRDANLIFDALIRLSRQEIAATETWPASVPLIDNLVDQQIDVVVVPALPTETQVMAFVKDAIEKTETLKGAWLEVAIDDQGAPGIAPQKYVFKQILDSSRTEVQSDALNGIVASLLPNSRYIIKTTDDILLPYTELSGAIQAIIEKDIRFADCAYRGSRFVNDSITGSLSLAPRFQVVREVSSEKSKQPGLRDPDLIFDALATEFRNVVHTFPAYADQGITVVDNLGDSQIDIVTVEAPPSENALMREIAVAITTTPGLRGAWIDVRLDNNNAPGVAPTTYVFSRGLDLSKSEEQIASIQRFIEQHIPAGRWKIDEGNDITLPLSDLVNSINDIMDVDPKFAGCCVSTAYYTLAADGMSWELVPAGRIWKDNQRESILNLFAAETLRSEEWSKGGITIAAPSAVGLVSVKPNHEMAAQYYSDALKAFWENRYFEAGENLALASLEHPDNLSYRYWRILTELADNQDNAAQARLAATIDGFAMQRPSWHDPDLMLSIYRVQGPLRRSLIDAERQVLTHRTRNNF